MIEKMDFFTILERKKEIRFLLEKISQYGNFLFLAGSLANCLSVDIYRENGMPGDIDFATEADENTVRNFFEKEFPEAVLKASVSCYLNEDNQRLLRYAMYPYVENNRLDYKIYVEIHLSPHKTQEVSYKGLNIVTVSLLDEMKIKKALGREKDLMDLKSFNLN